MNAAPPRSPPFKARQRAGPFEWLKSLAGALLPTPRRQLTWHVAWPLFVFLFAYGALILGLEWSGRVAFAKPLSFLLMVVTPWVWWMHIAGYAGLGRVRSTVALFVRLSLVGLFAMLLAEPRSVRTSDQLSVMYVLDLSDSIGEGSTDAALEFVARTVYDKPELDEAGLVVFGRTAAVELPPRISFPLEAINSRIDRDATDISSSLSLAAAMLPTENSGRIVLISDGIQTEGAIETVLQELRSRDITVDVLPIDYQYDYEVWLERLELPRHVKTGENYEASVILSSLQAGEGTLVVTENNQEISRDKVAFEAGKNRYNIPIYLREPGFYEYAATIQWDTKQVASGRQTQGQDHLPENNTVIDHVYIEGEGKVLLVHDPQGDSRDWENLAATLRDGKRIVELRDAFEFPRNSLSLLPYDTIILVNVPADALDPIQMKSIHDAVYDLGIGLIMVGGENSFGPGGYHRSLLEDALPVSMDVTQKKILPKGALAIILHTCEFPEGNTWGKRITKQAIKVLGDQDEVGVLAYGSSGEQWLFELTAASEYEKMVPKINGAQIGDMPSFSTTMEKGLEGLMKSDAATRHMIIISDGDPSPPPPNLISKFIKNQVSVSMVAIFPHGGQDISKMRSICGVTGGRYYFPSDPNELPSIFIKEAKTLRRSMIQNETVSPEIAFPSPILKGLESIPQLHGYVLTTAKPRAKTILAAKLQQGEVVESDPILATWRYGLGTTAAFTSDLSPNWGADWMNWEQREALLSQLLTDVSRVQKQSNLRMWNYVQGNVGVVIVEDFHREESFLEMRARVTGPRGRVENIELKQSGPRRYQATLPLWGKGRYQVMAAGASGDRQEQAHGGFVLSYSPEYLRFRSDSIALNKIADVTQGEQLDANTGSETIYGRRQPKESSRRIFDWFLLGLACLIPLDVGLRRIQLDWSVVQGWLPWGKRSGESTEMMGTLLKRKRDVGARRERKVTDAWKPISLPPQLPQADAAGTMDAPSVKHLPADDDATDGERQPSTSTTGKLLDLKRKRDEDDL
jgi:uncharacterized membrane protein